LKWRLARTPASRAMAQAAARRMSISSGIMRVLHPRVLVFRPQVG
jgi:hypothetical protein